MAVPNTFGVPTQKKKNARTVTKQEGPSQTSSYIFDERIGRKRRHDPWFAKLGQCTGQSTQKKTSPPSQLLPTNSELAATDINNNNTNTNCLYCFFRGTGS